MNAQLKVELSPLRVGRITGSRVGAILGLNPYSTRDDVLREMVREYHGAPREFDGNEATRYGEQMEPQTLADYEAREGVMTYGGGEIILHPAYSFLAVTPDGLVGSDGMVECKAPFRASYTYWSEVPHYEAQMRLQMECAGRKWCDFAVLQRNGALWVSRLEHDPQWINSVRAKLEAFMVDFGDAIASPDQHLVDKVADMSANDKWRIAAEAYAEAKADEDEAKARVEKSRQFLIELTEAAGAKSAKGFGLQVISAERAGSIAYAKAIKDLAPGADLSKYTGKPTSYYTVKEAK